VVAQLFSAPEIGKFIFHTQPVGIDDDIGCVTLRHGPTQIRSDICFTSLFAENYLIKTKEW
jgi:hypothetical protein